MRSRLLLVMALGTFTGCRVRDANPTNTASATTSPSITIVAKDFSFDAPSVVPAGTVTIRLINKGPSIHHVQLMRLADGKTVADLAESMKKPGPLPAWVAAAGGPNAGVPGGPPTETTLTLTPGTYAILCLIPGSDQIPHFAKGMITPLTVTATNAAARAAPQSDVTMSLTDYAFTPSVPIALGSHTIRFENRGTQDHEALLVRLAPGKRAADLVAWVINQAGPPPAEPLGGITAIPVGGQVYITRDFGPGNYAFLCFIPDAKDGKMHVIHGMVKEFTIS